MYQMVFNVIFLTNACACIVQENTGKCAGECDSTSSCYGTDGNCYCRPIYMSNLSDDVAIVATIICDLIVNNFINTPIIIPLNIANNTFVKISCDYDYAFATII